MVVGAAISPATAGWMGGWADALVTVTKPLDDLEEVLQAFREGGGEGKPILLQAHLSYAPTEEEALDAAHREWRTNIFDSPVLADLRMPDDFAAAAAFVEPDDVAESVIVSADLAEHLDRLQAFVELDVAEVHLHNVHRDQESFIRDFGSHVLPELAR